MHCVGFVDTEDMNVVSGKRKYTSLVGYSSSKLAQVWEGLMDSFFSPYIDYLNLFIDIYYLSNMTYGVQISDHVYQHPSQANTS